MAAGPVSRKKRILGWSGVAVTVLISGFWEYWGAFENFHEGWYSSSLLDNLLMFLLQYMSVAIAFTVLGLVAVRFKRLGLALHLLAGAGASGSSGAPHLMFWGSPSSFRSPSSRCCIISENPRRENGLTASLCLFPRPCRGNHHP